MISRRSFSTATGALFCMVMFGTGPALAAETIEPVAFIEDIGQEAISSLTQRELSDQERQARFRKIFRRSFDIRTIARFSLGRYWRIASKPEREEYVGLFEDFIVQAYAHRFKDYNGETFKVGKVLRINDSDTLVMSQLHRPRGPPIQVHWRVRASGELKIVDVVVEGISMGITQRAEFASVIRNSGGKVAGLLTALREKTGKE